MKKYLSALIFLQLCLGGLLIWDYVQTSKHDKVIHAHVKHVNDKLYPTFLTEVITYHEIAKFEESFNECEKSQALLVDFVKDYEEALINND